MGRNALALALVDDAQRRMQQARTVSRWWRLAPPAALLVAVALSAIGAGALPWWTPAVFLLVLCLIAWVVVRREDLSRKAAIDFGMRRYPRGGREPQSDLVALGWWVAVVALGAATGWWWVGAIVWLLRFGSGWLERARWRRLLAGPIGPHTVRRRAVAQRSDAMADPDALRLASALAVILDGRLDAIANLLDVEPERFDAPIDRMKRNSYLVTFQQGGARARLTRKGRRAYEGHVAWLERGPG